MSPPPSIERARAALDEAGLEGLVITPGESFAWLTGLTLERSERLVCLGVPRNGAPWLVCPAFEGDRLEAALPDLRILPWDEDEDPFRLAAAAMEEAGGTWSVEPTTAYHDATRLETAGAIRLVDGAALFASLRRAKDASEIDALRAAIDLAWDALAELLPRLSEGITEAEAADCLADQVARRGADPWALVQFGASSAVPHGEPGSRPLARGAAVLIDWGGWRDGFSADLTRSFWWDGAPVSPAEAPEAYREIHAVVRRAQRAALERAAPGVACGDVDRAAREVVERAGLGPWFTHRTGHGLGRSIHEPPYLVKGNDEPLAVGDVVTVEPGVYVPARYGVRWEDVVLITGNGVENLSARSDEPVPA